MNNDDSSISSLYNCTTYGAILFPSFSSSSFLSPFIPSLLASFLPFSFSFLFFKWDSQNSQIQILGHAEFEITLKRDVEMSSRQLHI